MDWNLRNGILFHAFSHELNLNYISFVNVDIIKEATRFEILQTKKFLKNILQNALMEALKQNVSEKLVD